MFNSAARWSGLAIVGALLSFPLIAGASGGSGISWTIQDTGITDSYGTVLGMRDGNAWPVIFTGYGNAYTLFPIGNSSSNPYAYKKIGSSLFGSSSSSGYGLRASTSANGQIVVTQRDTGSSSFNGTVTSTTVGFNSLAANVTAAAFDKNGNLITATKGSSSQSISSLGVISSSVISSDIYDIAVSSFNAIGVISSGGYFTEYNPWYGWLPSTSLSYLGRCSDLTYDAKGRPHVVTKSNTSSGSGYSVLAYDFDTIKGQWVITTLGTAYSSSTALSIASNDQGTVGTAFVDYDGNLIYAYKEEGSSTWSKSLITSGLFSYNYAQVGIAYDYAGLPVVSYTNSNGGISLAYDPIVIPEPATFSLLAIAVTATLLRRR